MAKSPSQRDTAWATLIIRSKSYAMLKEIAEYYGISNGQAAMDLIEREFNKLLEEQNNGRRN
jgi:type III secretory pathway component EscV